MEFKTRTKSPADIKDPKPQPAQPDSSRVMATKNSPRFGLRSGKSRALLLLVGVFILALLVVGVCWAKKSFFSVEAAIQRDKFQAVFLTNGQVYFGHLSDIEANYAKVTDVFYLQTQQQTQADNAPKDQQPQVSLTKLGSSELHGPQDTMYIAKNQILFWENLKDDGKVVQAIKGSQKN